MLRLHILSVCSLNFTYKKFIAVRKIPSIVIYDHYFHLRCSGRASCVSTLIGWKEHYQYKL